MTQDERWMANWQEVMDFMMANKRRPSKFADEERGMRNWWKHQHRIRGRFSDPFLFAIGDAVYYSVWDSGESGKLAETCGMASDFRRLIFSGSVLQYE